jgi:hypothetical protein
MNKISVKYKSTASSGDIKSLEQKYRLKRERVIPVLRVYGYSGGVKQMAAIEKEVIVEYVEQQEKMGIAD